jgi:hypothetical protein
MTVEAGLSGLTDATGRGCASAVAGADALYLLPRHPCTLVRSSMLELYGADFIRTARAKEADRWRVTLVHAFRFAAGPSPPAEALLRLGLLGTGWHCPGAGSLVRHGLPAGPGRARPLQIP